MAKDIIVELKAWLPYFYVNGEWVESPKMKFNGREVEEETKEFLSALLHSFLGGALNNCSLIWLKSNLSSVNKAIEFYNSQCDEVDQINIKTAQSKIFYDKNRLSKYFSDNLILNVLAYPNKYLDQAWESLDAFNRAYFNDKEYRDSMVLRLDKKLNNKSLGSGDWESLIEVISRYSKEKIKALESGNEPELSPDMIGYYNYLISSKRLSAEDIKRLDQLRKVLGLS